jgi:alpha-tubulin suppressor-like RCC1 family protein
MARETLKNCLMTVGPLLFLVFPSIAWTGDKSGGEQSAPPGIERGHKYIAAASDFSLAVTCDGHAYAWGYNANCECAHEFGPFLVVPVLIDELPANAVEVVGGGFHGMSLMSDGTVYAWGDNSDGQLGVHSKNDSCSPLLVHGPGDVGYLTGITRLAAAGNFSLAVKDDGSLWAWGNNGHGQLGIGSNDNHTIPYQVHGPGDVGYLTDVVDVATGEHHTLAVRSDGTVYAWGGNGHGQLGIHSNNDHTVPYQVHGPDNVGYLTDIIQVDGGKYFSLALRNDGTVWAWGENYYGQLGIHSNNDHTVPYQVHGPDNVGYLTDVVDIAGGHNHTLALKSDGTVYAWGGNGQGQLGIGSNHDHTVPYQVHGPGNVGFLTDIIDVDAGANFSLALRNDGTVWAWGEGSQGQLGINSFNDHTVPYQVHGADNVGYLTRIGPTCGPPGTPPPGGVEVAICHRPGTPNQKTLYLPWSALTAHFKHGDRPGICTP